MENYEIFYIGNREACQEWADAVIEKVKPSLPKRLRKDLKTVLRDQAGRALGLPIIEGLAARVPSQTSSAITVLLSRPPDQLEGEALTEFVSLRRTIQTRSLLENLVRVNIDPNRYPVRAQALILVREAEENPNQSILLAVFSRPPVFNGFSLATLM